jgi:acyl-CoA thioesterase-2
MSENATLDAATAQPAAEPPPLGLVADPLGLRRLLDLSAEGPEIFVAPADPEVRRVRHRLFGGQVAAQAVMAAGRTVELCDEQQLHSLHAYFLRPGRAGDAIRYEVARSKDGRSFAARSVTATQGDEVIFSLQASFTRPEDGIAHQEARMPDAPDPEAVREEGPWRAFHAGDAEAEHQRNRFWTMFRGPVEMREVPRPPRREGEPPSSLRRVWIRPRAPLPNDALVHAAVLVWVSDRSLIGTGAVPHPELRRGGGASLDHAMWMHHPPRFDDWHLFVMDSPVANAARALIHGSMYRRDGTRVVSTVQEGLIRAAK